MAASRVHSQLCNDRSMICTLAVLLLAGIASAFAGDLYNLAISTYFGGSGWEHARDIYVNGNGNIYVCGGTASHDFPTTEGAYDRTFNFGDTSGQECDAFICKFGPGGQLIWSTFLGGPGYDRAYGMEVDAQGYVYVAGRAGRGFPTTPGAFQPTFQGYNGGGYGGYQNGFVAKLSPDGSQLVWASYVGVAQLCRDIAIDERGDVYLPLGNPNQGALPPSEWFANAFQKTPNGGTDCGVIKVSSDGSGWPIKNAHQSTFAGGPGDYGAGDGILAKFAPASTITLDPQTTYQTIRGWEAVAYALEPGNAAYPNFKDALFTLAVNDVGINRVRLEVRSGVENSNDNWSGYQAGTIDYPTWRSRRYATVNDDADPQTINPDGFHFSEMDYAIDRVVNPLRQAMEANGDRLCVNVNYVAFTNQITDGIYLHNDPAEYAEFVLATYLHLQEKYGWVPDLWEVILEPDNVSQWNGKPIGEAIVAVAQRLRAAGFEPAFVAPSNTNMTNAVQYFDQMIAVPGVLPVLRELSYHRYSGVSLQSLLAIAARARQHGIDTAMLEWWSSGNGYTTLHEDLKIGNNSAWEQGVLAGAMNSDMSICQIDDSDAANPRVLLTDKTKFLRQYYKFVRPGAVRIEATSQQAAFDPLAFINADGSYVVVVKCNAGGEFFIDGLAPGTYGIKYTTAAEFDVDLPAQTIQSGQAVAAQIPQAGVLTVYGTPEPLDSQAPTAPTELAAGAVSASQVTLTRAASTDNVAIAGYKVYRDNVRIGFSSTSPFVDAQVEAGKSYVYEVSAYDTAGNESFRSVALAVTIPALNTENDLLGYWKFDETAGNVAIDASEYGHYGTIFKAVRVPGKSGKALDFGGLGNYVQIELDPVLDNLEAVTMTAWILPRMDSHWHVLDKGDGDKRLYSEGASRTLNGRVRYSGTHAVSASVSNTVVLDTWQHVAMVWSHATNRTRLYRNGVEVSYDSQDTGSGVPQDDTDYPFVIGARGALGDVTFFNGLMDEVRLYKRALSAQEIAEICGEAGPPPRPPGR